MIDPTYDFTYHARRLQEVANGDLQRATTLEEARRALEAVQTVVLDIEYDLALWEKLQVAKQEAAMSAQPAHDPLAPA